MQQSVEKGRAAAREKEQKQTDRQIGENKTFSAKIRDFIIAEYTFDKTYQRLLLHAFAGVGLRQQGRKFRFASRSPELVRFIERLFFEEYAAKVTIVEHKERITCSLSDPQLIAALGSDLEQFYLHNPASFSDFYPEEEYQVIKTVLSGLYLGCGAMANPEERYDLEFAVPKRSTSLWYGLFLAEVNLEPGRVYHQGSELLYLKDGERIADFLRYIGADQLLLEFEQIRVAKDMRNRVNRIVNCDNANAQRIANTVARQLQDIEYIKENGRWQELPENVRRIAELRMAYPDYSLQELAELTAPPLGKSGVNHRLKKIEKFADTLRKQ